MPAQSYPFAATETIDGDLDVDGAGTIDGPLIVDPDSVAVAGDAGTDADDAILGNTTVATASGMTILTTGAGIGKLAYGDAADPDAGAVYYDHAGFMGFRAGGQNQFALFDGTLRPITDSDVSFGASGFRWTNVFAEQLSVRTPSGFVGEEAEWTTYHVSTTDDSNNDVVVADEPGNQRSRIVNVWVQGCRDEGDNFIAREITDLYTRTGGVDAENTMSAGTLITRGTGSTATISLFGGGAGDTVLVRVTGNVGENWEWTIGVKRQGGGFTS